MPRRENCPTDTGNIVSGGPPARQRRRDRPGAHDSPNERLYYAIRTGTADRWDGLPVRQLSSSTWLVAPGLELIDNWFGGWCELPDDDTLTDPDILRAALHHPYMAATQEASSGACRQRITTRLPADPTARGHP
ncbi:hypothetical protein ACFWWC_18665 [Streptomyces sp. NPDC058642]|uniref:hypothetical protein n=1 Tax=Streptomyces sp. NPDC058642 TaxID=3346572 RepID=UPI00364E4B01